MSRSLVGKCAPLEACQAHALLKSLHRQNTLALLMLPAAALLVATLVLSATAIAQARRLDLQPLPEPPPPPAGVLNTEPEPEVTVRKREGDTIEEYRVAGRLVMIRVTPAHGVPYVLTDSKGDGSFSSRRDSIEYPPGVPMWVLFTF